MANETNTGLPTLANRVSSLFSGGMSIARVDWTPRPAYFMSVLETAVLLQPMFLCSIEDMVALCLYPRALGGFPVMMYSSMRVRGQMDPVSVAASMLVHLWRHYKNIYCSLSKLVNLDLVLPVDYNMLILDPHSLNILVPLQGENYVQRQIEKHLPSKVRNEQIIPLFEARAEGEEVLFKDLLTMQPLDPRLCNYIYGSL